MIPLYSRDRTTLISQDLKKKVLAFCSCVDFGRIACVNKTWKNLTKDDKFQFAIVQFFASNLLIPRSFDVDQNYLNSKAFLFFSVDEQGKIEQTQNQVQTTSFAVVKVYEKQILVGVANQFRYRLAQLEFISHTKRDLTFYNKIVKQLNDGLLLPDLLL